MVPHDQFGQQLLFQPNRLEVR